MLPVEDTIVAGGGFAAAGGGFLSPAARVGVATGGTEASATLKVTARLDEDFAVSALEGPSLSTWPSA